MGCGRASGALRPMHPRLTQWSCYGVLLSLDQNLSFNSPSFFFCFFFPSSHIISSMIGAHDLLLSPSSAAVAYAEQTEYAALSQDDLQLQDGSDFIHQAIGSNYSRNYSEQRVPDLHGPAEEGERWNASGADLPFVETQPLSGEVAYPDSPASWSFAVTPHPQLLSPLPTLLSGPLPVPLPPSDDSLLQSHALASPLAHQLLDAISIPAADASKLLPRGTFATAPTSSSESKEAAIRVSAAVRTRAACIPCRTAKVSCTTVPSAWEAATDTAPPTCVRCASAGRVCARRSMQDIMDARQRRVRKPDRLTGGGITERTSEGTTTAAAATAAVEAKAVLSTPLAAHVLAAATPAVSVASSSVPTPAALPFPLPRPQPFSSSPALSAVPTPVLADSLTAYHECALRVLIASGLRDEFLQVDALYNAAPLVVMERARWIVRCHLLLMYASECLSIEGMHTWLIHGLTPQQVNSSSFQCSPLASWLTPGQRPLFRHSDEERIHTHAYVSKDSMLLHGVHDTSAQLLIHLHLDGGSIVGLQQWEQLELRRRQYRRQRNIARGTACSSADGVSSGPSAIDSTSAAVVAACASEEDDLAAALLCLRAGSRNDLEGTTWHTGDSGGIHAMWCPLRKSSAATSTLITPDTVFDRSKRARGSDGAPLSLECQCADAIPLRCCTRINGAFERFFGWSEAEVMSMMRDEGTSFLRRVVHPSAWPNHSLSMLVHKSQRALRLLAHTCQELTQRIATVQSQSTSDSQHSITPTQHLQVDVLNSSLSSVASITEGSSVSGSGSSPTYASPTVASCFVPLHCSGPPSAASSAVTSANPAPSSASPSHPPEEERYSTLLHHRWGASVPGECDKLVTNLPALSVTEELHTLAYFMFVWREHQSS